MKMNITWIDWGLLAACVGIAALMAIAGRYSTPLLMLVIGTGLLIQAIRRPEKERLVTLSVFCLVASFLGWYWSK